ncbi:triose-phosphate isomerase family protein [Promicromonospora sp. NPDC023987]|uniref:triose-phosphate isomerase n=1 Tax=Promicromonospora sp. NPDC023987 TaxID=3155360 RepID=UPI0033C27D87
MPTTTTTSPFWLGTSWKMTKTLAQAGDYADELRSAALAERVPPELRLFVLPATTTLAAVRERLGVVPQVFVGAQNAYPGPEGAVTGEVSMGMVRDAGARMVEIGHAERRTLLGETDELVAAKVAAAVSAGLIPLVCVGETAAERERGSTASVIAGQVHAALGGLGRLAPVELLVAYEPHWAIGAQGRAAAPDDVAEGLAAVRQVLDDELPDVHTGVLYGGSVDAGNAAGLAGGLAVEGLFVGRAAWTASGLLEIAHRCADAVRARSTTDQAIVRKDR